MRLWWEGRTMLLLLPVFQFASATVGSNSSEFNDLEVYNDGPLGPGPLESFTLAGLKNAKVDAVLENQPSTTVQGTPKESPTSSGILLVRHSQTALVPTCPVGHTKLWDGYSLLYVQRMEASHQQDLGATSYCLKKFSTVPFLSCDLTKSCHYSRRGDRTYWISADVVPVPMTPVNGDAIRLHISRCVVCETPATNIIAIHSQTVDVPRCPDGWKGVWSGYSFLMYLAGDGGGQSLTSPGSCLEHFRTGPFIECNWNQCIYFNKYSFWLATIEDKDQFQKPESQDGDGAWALRNKVSRCQVCMKGS